MGTPLNGVIVYKSRYGSTEQYGEWIRQALRIPMIDPERLDHQVLSVCDFLLIGTPVYMGKMLIGDWLRHNEERLRGTQLFLFIVCTHYSDIERQQIMIRDNIPCSLLGSCDIRFLPGKLALDSLTREDTLLLNLSAPSEGDEDGKKTAIPTTDPVQQGNLNPLLEAVRSFAAAVRAVR